MVNLKDLFIKSDGDENKSEAPQSPPTTFSSPSVAGSGPAATQVFSNTMSTANPLFLKVLEMYQKKFDELNLPNPDFWEFYQAIHRVPNPNADAYVMAYTMIGIPKETILGYATTHYIPSLEKTHKDNATSGATKLNNINQQKTAEESQLRNEVNTIEQQIAQLQTTLANKNNELAGIEQKFANQLNETTSALQANDLAKEQLLSKINTVISGIQNYIK